MELSENTIYKTIFADKHTLSNYAFSLSLFMAKLDEAVSRDGISDVFFLAREGKYLKQLFEHYIKIFGGPHVGLHYLYVSRKSCLLPTLRSFDEENFEPFSCYHALSLSIFLKALLFKKNDIACIAAEIGADGNKIIENFFSSTVWSALKENKRFIEKYEKMRSSQRHNFLRYLEQAGFTSAKRPAIVDVGWRGTMQDLLFSLGLHQKLTGYYIGVYRDAATTPDCKKYGLLFDDNVKRNAFYYNNNYFEYLCVADHGSTEKYTEDGIPVLTPDEDSDLYSKYFYAVQKDVLDKFCAICIAAQFPEEIISLGRLFEKYHARMLLSLNKSEKVILAYALNNHPDGLAQIRPKNNLKTVLSKVKKYVILISRGF